MRKHNISWGFVQKGVMKYLNVTVILRQIQKQLLMWVVVFCLSDKRFICLIVYESQN
jgi:hypothetical protein